MRILIVLSIDIIAGHSFQGGGATIRSPPSFTSPAIAISRKTSTLRWGLGYDYLAEVWNEYTPDELDENFGALLMTFSSLRLRNLPKPTIRTQRGRGVWSSLPKR
jgi:hypothetical protein